MTALFNKLFPGSSSASNIDLGSMESLCTAINNLENDDKESIGMLAAQLVRQNKDLFEKKSNDAEAFLLSCNPNVASAAMVAAIKGMFDFASSKNNETAQDRAVELINHYVDENILVGEHLKCVPEIIFPLLQKIGLYCMEKKNKPEIGQRILSKALGAMFPRGVNGPKCLTSAHSVLFACALKTKDFEAVAPFIDIQIDEIANEKNVQEENEETPLTGLGRQKKTQSGPLTTGSSSNKSYLNPKFVLDYLYSGACILIELKRYEDALFLLDTLVNIPAFTAQDQHTDGYKKFVLLSLLINGQVIDNTEKVSGTRNLKPKSAEYKTLSEVKFSRSANTHSKMEDLVHAHKDKLKKDGNLELAKLVVVEMKKKTILSLTQMFTSVQFSVVQELSFLKSRALLTELIEQLVAENRINVRMEGDMIFWSETTQVPTKDEVENKIRTVDNLNELLEEKNKKIKSGSGRLRPSVMYNEDEGLSMPPAE